jgi:hypothetical protein
MGLISALIPGTETCMTAPAVPENCVIPLSAADVSKTFKQVNIHKAAGPDGLSGRVLRACAHQLESVSDIQWHFQPLPVRVCNTSMF